MTYYKKNLIVLSVTVFLASVSWNQVVPFLQLYIEELGVRGDSLYDWTSVTFAAHPLAAIAFQPLWGKLGDLHGRKLMTIRAGICLTLVYFGMSLAREPWQLAGLRFANGALTGFIPGSIALIATNTPDTHSARYIAIVQSAIAAGAILGPALGGSLAEVFGYRGTMVVSGTAVALSTLVVGLIVSEPNKPKDVERTSMLHDFTHSVKDPIQSSLLLAVLFATVLIATCAPFLAVYLQGLGDNVTDFTVGAVFALPALAFALSARKWAHLGEKHGFDKTILAGLIGGTVFTAMLFFTRNIYLFAGVFFMAGLFFAALMPSIGAATCLLVDEKIRGRVYGIQQSAMMTGHLVLPLVAGQVARTAGIPSLFLLSAALTGIGAVVLLPFFSRWRDHLAEHF